MSNSRKNATKQPTHLDDILSNATPAERVVHVCVAGGMLAEHQQLEAQLEDARQAEAKARVDDEQSATLGGKSKATKAGEEVRKLAQRIVDLEDRMRSYTYTFRFHALEPKEWSDLLAAHEARSGKQEAFNVDTLPPAAIAASCAEPAGMDTAEAVEQLFVKLNQGQRNDLFNAAWEVNTQAVDIPFSYAASAVLQTYGRNSTSAAPKESPEASSSAG